MTTGAPMIQNTPEVPPLRDGEIVVEWTAEQGTYFLKRSFMQVWPKGIGKRPFEDQLRAEIVADLAILRQTLLGYSFYAQRRIDRVYLFGPAEAWVTDGDGVPTGEIADPDKKYKVRLGVPEQNAVYWLLLYAAHPSSPIQLATLEPQKGPMQRRDDMPNLERVVWPVADALKYTRLLKKDIGLLAKERATKLLKDDDPAWDEKEEKEEPAKA